MFYAFHKKVLKVAMFISLLTLMFVGSALAQRSGPLGRIDYYLNNDPYSVVKYAHFYTRNQFLEKFNECWRWAEANDGYCTQVWY
jgi:hypothetical protein